MNRSGTNEPVATTPDLKVGRSYALLGHTPMLGLAVGALCLLLGGETRAFAVHDPAPSYSIPLNPIGFQSIRPEFLAEGSSLMTVHFAGKDKLLVTFGLRQLVPREPNDPPDDYDHVVGAYLLELPTGKVLAKTQWLMHDRGQYLWEIGDGRFLLRVRDRLTVLEPLQGARPEDALREHPFLHIDRRIVAIAISAEHDLLTVESTDREQVVLGDSAPAAGAKARAPVQINFFRLIPEGGKLLAVSAGVLRSPVALALPVNSAGYLDAVEGKRDQWLFRYTSAGGKVNELSAFDTSCFPKSVFVSRSEFIAFGCRGSVDRLSVAGFSLDGDFMWQQNLFDNHVSPSFAFAPEAGRFAMGRTILTPGASAIGELTASEITSQEIRVYQTYDGKVILRIACTPVVRAGQNFALSADGMHLAVLRETEVQHKATKNEEAYASREATVDIYDLPGLTKRDRAAVDDARKFALPEPGPRIELATQRTEPGVSPAPAEGENETPAQSASAASGTAAPLATEKAAAMATTDESSQTDSGDLQPTGPRTPPTLYAPGEKPEGSKPQKQ